MTACIARLSASAGGVRLEFGKGAGGEQHSRIRVHGPVRDEQCSRASVKEWRRRARSPYRAPDRRSVQEGRGHALDTDKFGVMLDQPKSSLERLSKVHDKPLPQACAVA